MRSAIPFVLSLLLARPAAAEFSFALYGYDADGAYVTISASGYNEKCSGFDCYRKRTYFTIQPCPPGQPCDGGVSEVVAPSTYLNLTLAYSTHYTISSYTTIAAGINKGGACNATACLFTSPTTSGSYSVPAHDEVARWQVSLLEADGPNVWVDVNIESDHVDGRPCYDECRRHNTQVVISPCPASARVHVSNQPEPVTVPVNCMGGTATFDVFSYPTADPRLELLLPPGEYSVYGHWDTTSATDFCSFVTCQFFVYSEPVSFNSSTLPVRSTTWGGIKELYRRR